MLNGGKYYQQIYTLTFLDGKVSYNTIELKSGVAFEYLFAKKYYAEYR
jgi:hypothetical protein